MRQRKLRACRLQAYGSLRSCPGRVPRIAHTATEAVPVINVDRYLFEKEVTIPESPANPNRNGAAREAAAADAIAPDRQGKTSSISPAPPRRKIKNSGRSISAQRGT